MSISHSDVNRWKKNSLEIALKLGYKINIVRTLEDTKVFLEGGFPTGSNLYGVTVVDDDKKEKGLPPRYILIYKQNISTAGRVFLEQVLERILDQDELRQVMEIYDQLGEANFFELFGQNNMDHEIIGHMYNYLDGQDSGEKAASLTQIKFAEYRSRHGFSKNHWKLLLKVLKVVLRKHKGIDV